jgi:hypothetical protein
MWVPFPVFLDTKSIPEDYHTVRFKLAFLVRGGGGSGQLSATSKLSPEFLRYFFSMYKDNSTQVVPINRKKN